MAVRVIVFDEQQKLPTSIRNATIEPVEFFQDLSSCLASIEQQTIEDKMIILITSSVEENHLQAFQALTSIEVILILSTSSKDVDTFPSKVFGMYPQTDLLLRTLTEIIDALELQLNAKSMIFNCHNDASDNFIFYFYYLWKNSTADHTHTNKKSLADQARLIFRSSNQIKTSINEFETSYKPSDVLQWLDKHRHPFPYHLLLSNALRTHNQEVLSLARFFLHDLAKQMKPTAAGTSHNQVYLGTKLPSTVIDEFEQQTKTDIVIFQCFLPVTRSRASALLDATRSTRHQKKMNVLFKIDLNHAMCATLGETSYIDAATPFHLNCVTKSTSGGPQLLVIIKLKALDKTEREQLFEQFIQRQQKAGRTIDDVLQRIGSDTSDHETLADEHIARREWSEADKILTSVTNPNVRVLNKRGCLLREHLDNLPGALECHQQALLKAVHRERADTLLNLGLVYNNLKQYDEAYKMFTEALQWLEKQKKPDLSTISRCYVGLGNVEWARGKLDEALSFAERALAIREYEVKPRNDFDVAACLGNMGNILYGQGDIRRALACATRAVELLSACGKGDARLAAALNNLGALHHANGDLTNAREYFERALQSFPNENHPQRKSTLANIARLDTAEQPKK